MLVWLTMAEAALQQKSFLSGKVEHFTESVIREMTRQAMLYKAVNLAQGFPDFPAPREVKESAQEAIAGDNDLYMDRVTKKSFANCGLVQLKLAKPMTIAYVETGFDGGALVYELRSGRERVGIEVEMDFAELEAFLEDEDPDDA